MSPHCSIKGRTAESAAKRRPARRARPSPSPCRAPGPAVKRYACGPSMLREDTVVPLALFDLDNTLLAGDSDHAWGTYLCERGLVDARTTARATMPSIRTTWPARSTCRLPGLLPGAARPQRARPVAGLARGIHARLCRTHGAGQGRGAGARASPSRRPGGDHHRHQPLHHRPHRRAAGGRYPAGHRMRDDRWPLHRPHHRHPLFPGRQGQAPATLARRDRAQLEGSYFYSDSRNDLPLLEQVSHPVAVDPDPTLRQIAEQRGWKIISLR